MEITKEILESILDAYSYEIVFVDRQHIVRYMNKTAKERYGERVKINQSLFNCHSENSKVKIEEFLKRADAGEDEMFETYNTKTGEREFFVPVRDSNKHVIGYFERHEMPCFVQIQLNYVDWKHASGRNVNADYLYGELEKRNIPAIIMEAGMSRAPRKSDRTFTLDHPAYFQQH